MFVLSLMVTCVQVTPHLTSTLTRYYFFSVQANPLATELQGQPQTQLPTRRSFDSTTPANSSGSRRRTTQSSVSLSLDGLDLSGLRLEDGTPAPSLAVNLLKSELAAAEDPGSFGKSRLLTKWGVSLKSSASEDGLSAETSSVSAGSDECHIMADIKLLGPKVSPAGAMLESDGVSRHSMPQPAAAVGATVAADIKEPVQDELRRVSLDDKVYDQSAANAQRKPVPSNTQARPFLAHAQSAPNPSHQPMLPSKHLTSIKAMPQRNSAGGNMQTPHLPLDLAAAVAATNPTLGLSGLNLANMDVPSAAGAAGTADVSSITAQQMQQLQATMAMKAQQMQQQYASALAQFNAARNQMLAAAAVLQGGPYSAPLQSPAMAGFLPNATNAGAMYPGADLNPLVMMQNAHPAMRGVF